MHYKINVYILTDSQGEWWEDITSEGIAARFIRGSYQLSRTKEFKTLEKAKKFAEKTQYKRFRIFKMTPPVAPSRTWGQEIVYQQENAV